MLDNIKGRAGSFRFYGHWLGRATDSIYKLSKIDIAKDGTITIILEDDEKVIISNPSNLVEKKDCIVVEFADEVIFQWYYYGKDKTKENLYHFRFKYTENEIQTSSNVDWYKPKFKTEYGMNALELWFYE